jgi:hypothetical protein
VRDKSDVQLSVQICGNGLIGRERTASSTGASAERSHAGRVAGLATASTASAATKRCDPVIALWRGVCGDRIASPAMAASWAAEGA